MESGIQKTNKGCTSNLAESKCVSLFAHWYLTQDFRCRKDCESVKYDVQPLFVFCTLISSLISLRKLNNDLMPFKDTVQLIHSTFFWCWQRSGKTFQQIKSKNKIKIITWIIKCKIRYGIMFKYDKIFNSRQNPKFLLYFM